MASNTVGLENWVIKASTIFLCLALFAYPFSVAASNVFFALLVLSTLLCIRFMHHGILTVFREYTLISWGIALMVLITIAGYFWSSDTSMALHQVEKQLNWLILPAIVGVVSFAPASFRKYAFITFSLAMLMHLMVCTLQYQGVLNIQGLGSSRYDATGFLGHLSFGFIYSLWIGALIIVAEKLNMKWRLVCYAMSLYASITILMAHGRSGYILLAMVFILVIWKALFPKRQKIKIIALLSCVLLAACFLTLHQQSKVRVLETISGVEAYLSGDWDHVDPRFKVWTTGIEVWKTEPWFGIGTGDYLTEAKLLLSSPEFKHLRDGQGNFSHPHNEFLFALVRWGPIGLGIVAFLCWAWIYTGWKKDWRKDTINAYLMTSSGLAVLIQGMTEVSLNSRLTFVFAIIVLAFSMTKEAGKEKV